MNGSELHLSESVMLKGSNCSCDNAVFAVAMRNNWDIAKKQKAKLVSKITECDIFDACMFVMI